MILNVDFWNYYDYQLSKERRSLNDEVLDLKLRSCHGQHRPLVTVLSPESSRALLPMTSTADKLPLETEPVARNNNTSWTLKPSHQNFVAPYSTDNRSMPGAKRSEKGERVGRK